VLFRPRDPGRLKNHISESLETIFWVKILKISNANADKGSRNLFDPGSGMGEKFGSGINIPDPSTAFNVVLYIPSYVGWMNLGDELYH
jgi:hypothetical protein